MRTPSEQAEAPLWRLWLNHAAASGMKDQKLGAQSNHAHSRRTLTLGRVVGQCCLHYIAIKTVIVRQ